MESKINGGIRMMKWTDRNFGSIVVEVTDGKITEMGAIGSLGEMSTSIALLIKGVSESNKIDKKEIIGCINYLLYKLK